MTVCAEEDPFSAARDSVSLAQVARNLQWSYRLLVVDKQVAADQLQLLDRADLIERDLVVVTFGPRHITVGRATSPGVRMEAFAIRDPSLPPGYAQALSSDGETMRVLLIGKDGGVKAAWPSPPSQADLNAIIDVMPMRAEEMRRGG